MSSEVYCLRDQALRLCRELPGIDDELTGLLLEATRDDDAAIRESAWVALRRAPLDQKSALQVFGRALLEDDIESRSLALEALTDLGEPARETLVDYLEALEKPTAVANRDWKWIVTVENAIREIKPEPER